MTTIREIANKIIDEKVDTEDKMVRFIKDNANDKEFDDHTIFFDDMANRDNHMTLSTQNWAPVCFYFGDGWMSDQVDSRDYPFDNILHVITDFAEA